MANQDLVKRSEGLAQDDSVPKLQRVASPGGRPKIASPMAFLDAGLELDRAQERLKEFEGSNPVRRLDPARIRASKYQNRDEASFASPEFAELAADIATKGGNSTPIRVRRVDGDSKHDYEIVYGHRRHRACLLKGIPVAAEIVEADDRELFSSMTDENSKRNDLTPYEWGVHYQRGLSLRLFSTAEQLASETGRSGGHVSLCLAIARLPDKVLDAFPRRLEIQLKWGAAIADALNRDREEVLARAAEISTDNTRTARGVFEALTRDASSAGARAIEIKSGKKKVATITAHNGVVSVRFAKNAVAPKRLTELRRLLSEFVLSE